MARLYRVATVTDDRRGTFFDRKCLVFRATRAGGHLVRVNRVKDDSAFRCFADHG